MQLRLTKKFAEDINVTLSSPLETTTPFSDWVADIIFIERKKACLLIDRHTLIAFVFPYTKAAGIKGILHLLSQAVEKKLKELHLDNYISCALTTLSKPYTLVKTEDRKTIGHMSDFKFIMQHFKKPKSFDEISTHLHDIIISSLPHSFITPNERLTEILSLTDSLA